VSYSYSLLCEEIFRRVHKNPHGSIGRLSRELGVSRRTIQCVLKTKTGKTFRVVREEILMLNVKQLLLSQPGLAIKEVSFAAGFTSPRSFGRTVKRASGLCPEELRSLLARDYAGKRGRVMRSHSRYLPEFNY
jgi:AraC-like DNA-binding protein